MSSSPPIDPSPPSAARWRSPAGWSLRARLIATLIGLFAVLGLVAGATMEIVLRDSLYGQLDDEIRELSNRAPLMLDDALSSDAGRPGADRRRGALGRGIRQAQPGDVLAVPMDTPSLGGVLRVTSANRIEIESLSDEVLARLGALPRDDRPSTVDLGDKGDYRVTVRWVPLPQGSGVVFATGLPTAPVQSILYSVAGVVGGVLLLLLVAAALVGTVIIRRTLRPLSRVAATATRVSELRLDHGEVDLAQRVPDTDPRTEVGQVGAALNRMLDHVGTALERRHASETQVRQFVADASHELRTPLAAIRGYAELSRRSRTPIPDDVAHVLRRVESEATRMTALVEDLLLLARLDAGRPLGADPVDLTALAVDAVSDAHAAGPRHDWRLVLPEEPVVVIGDQARLHQVLANLLANARTHTPEGTPVVVDVGTDRDTAVLRVTDAGPGIPAALQPHIFERFARGDSSRSRAAGSTGLGLSIVHAVVSAHHGSVAVDSAPGHTEFTVRLPAARGPARQPDPVGHDLAPVVR